MEIKLGSLFDGSGGFCLAGLLSGCAYDVLRRVAEAIEKEKMTGEPA